MQRSDGVGGEPLEKVALLQKGQNKSALHAFMQLGFSASQLWLVEKVQSDDAAVAELQTYCVVLDEAMRQGWRNVLLLDLPPDFITPLFMELKLLLPGLQQSPYTFPLLARLPQTGCLCFASARHYAALQHALHRALEHGVSVDRIWTLLSEKYGWRVVNPDK